MPVSYPAGMLACLKFWFSIVKCPYRLLYSSHPLFVFSPSTVLHKPDAASHLVSLVGVDFTWDSIGPTRAFAS